MTIYTKLFTPSDIVATFSRQSIKVIAALLQQSVLNQTLNPIQHGSASTRVIATCFEQFMQIQRLLIKRTKHRQDFSGQYIHIEDYIIVMEVSAHQELFETSFDLGHGDRK